MAGDRDLVGTLMEQHKVGESLARARQGGVVCNATAEGAWGEVGPQKPLVERKGLDGCAARVPSSEASSLGPGRPSRWSWAGGRWRSRR